MHSKYHETVEKLRIWSQREDNIHGALILGSQAREEFKGDEWSDLDVLLLAADPPLLLQNDTWPDFLGEIVCAIIEETPLGWLDLAWSTKRVLFADNRAVDFSIMPYDRVDDVLALNAEIHAYGYTTIYDDCAMTSKIEATLADVKSAPPKVPTQDELHQTVNDFLFQLMFACKKIKRQELWVAVRCINQHINNRLLELIEYHTASVATTSQSIRYEGRFLEQRVHPSVLERLPHCFAKYDVADVIKTANYLLDTAQYLVKDICEENEYPFNECPFAQIRKLYAEMFENAL